MVGIVGGFGLGGQDVADGLEQPAVVVPVDPFERGILDGLKRSPWPVPPDDLSLLEAVGRLSEDVVVTVADAADGGVEARFGEAFGVLAFCWRCTRRPGRPRTHQDLMIVLPESSICMGISCLAPSAFWTDAILSGGTSTRKKPPPPAPQSLPPNAPPARALS